MSLTMITTLCMLHLCFSTNIAQETKQISRLKEREAVFSQCGGVLKESKGVISTPNFPRPYPVPILCRWVVEVPADRVVALSLTQFYAREGVTVTEYALYSSPTQHMGGKVLGPVTADRPPTRLVTGKPVLVLDFLVGESGNTHLRVRDHLLDVFGFNVTYETVARNETDVRRREDACVRHHCSFAGSCLASADFAGYACRCFGDHFGSECQYSPGCEPGTESECQNGGTCRYYIGSAVKSCECPSEFEGSKCEKRKNDRRLMAQCVALGCSQTCGQTNHGDYKCTCLAGHHLAEDKRTCAERGRTRYLVSFKLYDQNVDLAHLDATRYNQLKKGIENALLQLFQPRLHKTENMTVLSFQPGAVVQFHFFGEQEDSESARGILEGALRGRAIGKYAVDRNYVSFDWEPALSIQSIDASVKMPVVAGSELSLACVTQGSSAMRVTWYKDGAAVDVQTPYRSIWTTLVPKNSKDQYTAVLGFEKAHVLDSGEFTCQVSDWGVVHNRSIWVSVMSAPRPSLSPLAATLVRGEGGLALTCLHPREDSPAATPLLGYNWLKNGRLLRPSSDPEQAEDLYPSGSRLLLQSARQSATYACVVSGAAGSGRRESRVTVIATQGSTPTCQAEKYMEVKWSVTAANTEDIQFCPKGYTEKGDYDVVDRDACVVHNFTKTIVTPQTTVTEDVVVCVAGEVRRVCRLRQDDGAAWSEPDYSGCLSSELLAIRDKFESLRMGYLITEVGSLMVEVKSYLSNMRGRFHAGEGEPVVDLLEGMHDHQQQRTQGGDDERQLKNNSQVFLDIASFLLETPRLIQKQSHVIKLHQQILSHGLLHGSAVTGDTFHMFERSALVLEAGRVQQSGGGRVLRFPSGRQGAARPAAWWTDSLELDFDDTPGIAADSTREGNDSISIAVVFYKNFSAFLPERFLAQGYGGSGSVLHRGPDAEYRLHSRIVAVAVQAGRRNVGTSRSSGLKVKARMAHLEHTANRQIMWNISCGVADFSQGNVQFSIEGCQPVSAGNYSLCQCSQVGTYAVLLTTYAQPDEMSFRDGFEVIAGVGCAICAFFVFLTFFILLVLWRKISGAITALKLQVCFALIGAYATILKGLHQSLTKESFPWAVSLIQFFLVAAFSLQLCVGLTVYMEFVDMRGVRYPELKLAGLGWALPMIVVGATLAAQVPEGFRLDSWWIQMQTNYFYAFSISIVIITILQIMLVMTVKSELKTHKKLDNSKHSKSVNRSRLLNRSLVITLFLLLASASSIMYVNFEDELYKYAFSSSSGVLGFVIFLCYTVCSENARSLCSSSYSIEDENEIQEQRIEAKSETFHGFLKPEIVSDTYCGGKMKEACEVDVRREKLHFRMRPEEIEWKEVDRLLLEKSAAVVRDFTVHHQRSPLVVTKATEPRVEKGNNPEDQQLTQNDEHSPVTSPLQLQQLDDSPRSSQLHIKDGQDIELNDQETHSQFYELNIPKNTPPDILEPTKQTYFTGRLGLTTIGEQCLITTRKASDQRALVSDRTTSSYSTFRPPSEDSVFLHNFDKKESTFLHSSDQKYSTFLPENTLEHRDYRSKTPPSGVDKRNISLKNPDIGDESLVLADSTLKKKVGFGIQVDTPFVPNLDRGGSDPKEGWNITSV